MAVSDLRSLIPLLIPIMALGIPIVAILTKHQRDMAEIFNRRNQGQENNQHEIVALRQEMSELRELLHRQTIALDSLASRQTADAELRERVR